MHFIAAPTTGKHFINMFLTYAFSRRRVSPFHLLPFQCSSRSFGVWHLRSCAAPPTPSSAKSPGSSSGYSAGRLFTYNSYFGVCSPRFITHFLSASLIFTSDIFTSESTSRSARPLHFIGSLSSDFHSTKLPTWQRSFELDYCRWTKAKRKLQLLSV